MKTESIQAHVKAASSEAKSDMAKGQWDEVMADALYAACGAQTQAEMQQAKSIAEAEAKGMMRLAAIHDYQSGNEIGREEVNWADYALWMSGPSEVCKAERCLTVDQINRFGIQADTTVFCVEL